MEFFDTTFDEEEIIWRGKEIFPIFNPNISLGQIVLWKLERNRYKIGQINANNDIRMTNEEIRIKTIRAAQNLQKLGFQPNDVLGFMARNSHHVAPIIFAAFCLGCPINTIDPSFQKTEVMHMFSMTKPSLIFCDVDKYELMMECLESLENDSRVFTFGGTQGESILVDVLFEETFSEKDYLPTPVDGVNHVAAILCSSGTTGLSKGVCFSHASIADQMIRIANMGCNDILLTFSSLYWLSALCILMMSTLQGATRVITTDTFTPERLLSIIENYRVTFAFVASSHLVLIHKSKSIRTTDLSSIRQFMAGGSKPSREICIAMKKHFPCGDLSIGYGMTEMNGLIAIHFPYTGRDSVGKLVGGIHVKIIDEDGNRCGPGEQGEICIKNSYPFLGYYGMDNVTKASMDEDRFIFSGDIGYFDDDGYLYLVDRKKDMFKYAGYQISPTEIENFLNENPNIKTSCVVGIMESDMGELPAAVVIKASGCDILAQDIFDLVAENFSDYKQLRGGVYFVDKLPTTASGKIIRRFVKEIATQLYEETRNDESS